MMDCQFMSTDQRGSLARSGGAAAVAGDMVDAGAAEFMCPAQPPMSAARSCIPTARPTVPNALVVMLSSTLLSSVSPTPIELRAYLLPRHLRAATCPEGHQRFAADFPTQ